MIPSHEFTLFVLTNSKRSDHYHFHVIVLEPSKAPEDKGRFTCTYGNIALQMQKLLEDGGVQ